MTYKVLYTTEKWTPEKDSTVGVLRLSCDVQNKTNALMYPKSVGHVEDWIVMDCDRYFSDKKNWAMQMQWIIRQWKQLKINTIVLHMSSCFVHGKNKENCFHFIMDTILTRMRNISKFVVCHDGPKKKWIRKSIHTCLLVFNAKVISMLPANVATPATLAQHLTEMFEKVPRTSVRTWDDKELFQEGFGLIHSVGKSAINKPRFVLVSRPGADKSKVICIVGKGITFDTGGLAIKSMHNMEGMKYDKLGAIYASYALFELLTDPRMKSYTFYGLFPFAENAVSGMATRPGDVVKSYNGKSVEITDPDAEGRLVLADAFAYAAKHLKPDVILDLATLTGHAESINCWHSGYFYATPDWWKRRIEEATFNIGEKMIPMPSWKGYEDILESEVADLVNDPKGCSDAFTAALFLKEFVPKTADWLHIDIAHETDGIVPRGHGIRSMIKAVEIWVEKKK